MRFSFLPCDVPCQWAWCLVWSWRWKRSRCSASLWLAPEASYHMPPKKVSSPSMDTTAGCYRITAKKSTIEEPLYPWRSSWNFLKIFLKPNIEGERIEKVTGRMTCSLSTSCLWDQAKSYESLHPDPGWRRSPCSPCSPARQALSLLWACWGKHCLLPMSLPAEKNSCLYSKQYQNSLWLSRTKVSSLEKPRSSFAFPA